MQAIAMDGAGDARAETGSAPSSSSFLAGTPTESCSRGTSAQPGPALYKQRQRERRSAMNEREAINILIES